MNQKGFISVFQFTKEQLSDISNAFEIFNQDGTGLIPAKYLRVVLRAFGLNSDRNEVKRLAQSVGKEYEDKLNFDDFKNILQRIMSVIPPEDFLMKAFRLYDQNDTGKIDQNDLKEVANLLGDHLSEENIQDMILSATDDVSSTEVYFEDFLRILQKPFDIKLFEV